MATLEANLNSLLVNANPVKLITTFLCEAMVGGLQRSIKNGFTTLARTVSDVTETAAYATESLRGQAIQFEGAANSASQTGQMIFGWLRSGLVLGLIVLGHDLLHAHAYEWIGEIHPYLGPLASAAEAIPKYERGQALPVWWSLQFWFS